MNVGKYSRVNSNNGKYDAKKCHCCKFIDKLYTKIDDAAFLQFTLKKIVVPFISVISIQEVVGKKNNVEKFIVSTEQQSVVDGDVVVVHRTYTVIKVKVQ